MLCVRLCAALPCLPACLPLALSSLFFISSLVCRDCYTSPLVYLIHDGLVRGQCCLYLAPPSYLDLHHTTSYYSSLPLPNL